MRLDLVLKVSGLIKRRTVAKAITESGKVLVNGKVAKPSTEVKDGDVLTLSLGPRKLVVKITYELRYKKEYPIYEEISSEKVKSDA